MLRLSLALKISRDGEILISSDSALYIRVAEGRKDSYYCRDIAGTVWRLNSFRRAYLTVLLTVGGTSEDRYSEVICIL